MGKNLKIQSQEGKQPKKSNNTTQDIAKFCLKYHFTYSAVFGAQFRTWTRTATLRTLTYGKVTSLLLPN